MKGLYVKVDFSRVIEKLEEIRLTMEGILTPELKERYEKLAITHRELQQEAYMLGVPLADYIDHLVKRGSINYRDGWYLKSLRVE